MGSLAEGVVNDAQQYEERVGEVLRFVNVVKHQNYKRKGADKKRFHVFHLFVQAEDGIRNGHVTGVQTCALPIYQSILTAVNTFVENIHFIKDKTMSTKQLGYRCLAVNISDLAAMGAVPRFYLVSVVIPPNWEELDVLSVFDGLSQLAKKHQMDLIGGDTVSGDTFVLSVTVIGYADEEKVRYRSDAKVDDIVF